MHKTSCQSCNFAEKRTMRGLGIFFVIVILGSFSSSFAQTTFTFKDFDKLSVQGNIDLVLEKSDFERVVVTEKTDLLDIEQEGHTVKIKMNLRDQMKGEEVKVKVEYRKLKELQAGGGASVEARLQEAGIDFSAHLSSGASLHLQGEFNSLELSAATGSKIALFGKTDYLEAEAKTTGEIRANKFSVQKALLKAHTGGIIEASVERSLEASVSTAGELILYGTPEEEKISTTVGGKLTRIRSNK